MFGRVSRPLALHKVSTALSAGFPSQLLSLQRPRLCTLIQQLMLCTSAVDSDPLPAPHCLLQLQGLTGGSCFQSQWTLTRKHYSLKKKVPSVAVDGCHTVALGEKGKRSVSHRFITWLSFFLGRFQLAVHRSVKRCARKC